MSRRDPLRCLPALLLAGTLQVSAQQAPSLAPDTSPVQQVVHLPAASPSVPGLPNPPLPQVTFTPRPAPNATPEQLGDSLEARQRYQSAIQAYKKVQPPTAVVWNKMGIAYQMMLNLKEATRCYQESLKLDRHNASVYNNLGTVYDSEKKFGDAERMYRRALKTDPKSAVTYKNLGTNLLMRHKYQKGWDAYAKAMALDPGIFTDQESPRVENPSTVRERGAMNYYMARGCVRMGQTECALQYLRMALNEGFITPKKLAEDEDFFILRSNPGFKQMLAEQEQKKPEQQHP